MVLHPTTRHHLPSRGRLGLAVAYGASLIVGTALLIAVFPGSQATRAQSAGGQRMTYSEVVMQGATERALVSPQTAVLAGGTQQNEERGL
ncbi:MAG: hypothetical protein EOO54_19390 [Haliea sp.]|nr:MAG: hypothetical protein EOO54_19390 [Haliea sp.]